MLNTVHTCIMYRAMWTAPPVAAALAELAAGVQRARHAPACARAPPCHAYAHPQVTTAASMLNIHQAHKLLKLTSRHVPLIQAGL